MKAKKIFGVIIVLSVVAVIASTVALNTSNVEKFGIIQTDYNGVHSSDYSFDINSYSIILEENEVFFRPPTDPVGDEPFSYKAPVDPYGDEPIVSNRGPENPVGDEPLNYGD